jgi:DNA-binding CsgD family transcriptional regulator
MHFFAKKNIILKDGFGNEAIGFNSTNMQTLDSFISGPFINCDPELTQLFEAVDCREDVILYIPNIAERKLEYINSTCSAWLGYPQGDFFRGGPDFIFSITESSLIPDIIQKQIVYSRTPRIPGFDPKSIFVLEFPVKMFAKAGNSIDLHCLAVPLTYTMYGDMQVLAGIWTDPVESNVNEGKQILTRIKQRHNEIYNHPEMESQGHVLEPVYTTSQRHDELITPREKDVLALLSKGFSSKEIALKLSISSHTAESHRKSLLGKFAAKNAAELVKKASKVFWLE